MAHVRPFGGQKATMDETIPQSGLVQNVCRQWVMHEDEGLAHRLQEQEFQTHFGHNKEQRRTIQGDIKEARKAQDQELVEIERRHAQHVQQLRLVEKGDHQLAERIQATILADETEIIRRRKHRDEMLAAEWEEEQHQRSRKDHVWRESQTKMLPPSQHADNTQYQEPCVAGPSRKPEVPDSVLNLTRNTEEKERLAQELQDEEFARHLQELERQDSLARDDYKLAVESQDAEYARMLDEKEKERLKRLKEKHKAKKEQEANGRDQSRKIDSILNGNSPPSLPSRFSYPSTAQTRGNLPDDLITSFESSSIVPRQQHGAAFDNVATLIDPTYRRNLDSSANHEPPSFLASRSSSLRSTATGTGGVDGYCDSVGSSDPPYMPLNVQRKVQSLEKQTRSRSNKGAMEQVGDNSSNNSKQRYM